MSLTGYFAKQKFFDGVLTATNLAIITKLRRDADLAYLYTGVRKNGPGRPKQFDGKVDWNDLPADRWITTDLEGGTRLMTAVLWSPSLKRKVCVVAVYGTRSGTFTRYALLCSSDTTLSAETVYRYYTKRFQIEFLFRDAKQYAGLTHCQARSERKLHFHFNASLTAVSVAKVAHFIDAADDGVPTYSLADVGMAYCNEFYADFFFSKLDFTPDPEKIASALPSLLSFGLIHGW